MTLLPRRDDIAPAEDHGFFGPGSVAWKVWTYPTSLTVGFQRAVVVEELDPALVASVDQTQAIYDRPRTRYDRTIRYFALVAFGDTRTASRAADVLVKVHSKGIGTDPVTGRRYDANDPDSQLWILLTGWHSVLKAYEMYGPGRLSAEEEAEYWAQCAVAAELQTCDPADVPRTREELRAYYERMRPELVGSPIARRAMHHLLDARAILPRNRLLVPAAWVVGAVLRAGTIASMPRWMRELGGLRQPRVVDLAVLPVLWVAFRLARVSARLQLLVLGLISPSTVPIAAPVLFGVPPQRAETLTPAEARERYGYERPRDAHLDLRARQAARVFGAHDAPSDEGIVESVPVLGPTG